MFGKIFGTKKEVMDMEIYWDASTTAEDLAEDLGTIGEMMLRPMAVKNGCKFVIARNWWINERKVFMAELVVDKTMEKVIVEMVRNKKFKAVDFTKTHVC